MNRREALSAVSLIFGGTIVGAGSILQGCKPSDHKSSFGILSKNELRILDELAETILPHSESSPGAKEVGVSSYINAIVSDCYNAPEQEAFKAGIIALDKLSNENYDDDFVDLQHDNREAMLRILEKQSADYNKKEAAQEMPHYYTMMKQLAVWGYLSSELVGTKVLRLVPVPGRYEGCQPYHKGEKMYI